MVIPVKLTGFSVSSKANDVIDFLKSSGVKDFEMFLSIEKTGSRKNSFSGTAYVLVNSEIQVAHLLRLRGQRAGRHYIDITRCHLKELEDAQLFPSPSSKLFEEISLSRNDLKSYSYSNSRDDSVPKNSSKRAKRTSLYIENHGNHDTKRNKSSDGPGSRSFTSEHSPPRSRNKYRRESPDNRFHSLNLPDIDEGTHNHKFSDNSNPKIPYDCFIKLFYVPQEASKLNVLHFFNSVAIPSDVFFSYFDSGPHSGKMRREAFVLFHSQSEARRSLRLDSEKFGLTKIYICVPTVEEIDSVLYQHKKRLAIAEEPVSKTSVSNKKEELAYSLLNVVTNILSSSSQSAPRYENTMLDSKELISSHTERTLPFKDETKYNLIKVHISNVPPNVTDSELLQFFSGFAVVESSLMKSPSTPGRRFSDWEIGFETYEEANSAVRKLNYQLLRYQPIELQII